ncbi:hypothetical protein T484DRAFT_1920757 [Baffinella frigidus]|nr:hypothetical protein T484DRAFT_1920757 [Cryptophyta sp. CCMP2293]
MAQVSSVNGSNVGNNGSSGCFTPDQRRAFQDVTNRAAPSREATPPASDETLFVQTKVTISDMQLEKFTSSKRREFIGSVAATVDVSEQEVEVVSFQQRSGRRLLSSNLEVTVRICADTPQARAAIIKALHSSDLTAMLLQSGMRARPCAASPAHFARGETRDEDLYSFTPAKYRGGYSLQHSLRALHLA